MDIGSVHIAALSTQKPTGDELAWLEKDLAAAHANRKAVPWIIVTSHYPIFESTLKTDDAASSKGWYVPTLFTCCNWVIHGYREYEEGCSSIISWLTYTSTSVSVHPDLLYTPVELYLKLIWNMIVLYTGSRRRARSAAPTACAMAPKS